MPAKSEKPPSAFGVYFFATLMMLLGGSLGFGYLASFPAQAFSSQREYEASRGATEKSEKSEKSEKPVKAPQPGDAYFIEGPISQTSNWQAKRTQLQASGPQTVRLSAGEINAWMAARLRAGSPSEANDKKSILITPRVPNVAITETGELYFNLATKLSIYGTRLDLTVFARTVPIGADFRFETVHVSSAKVPLPDILGRRVFDLLLQSFQSTEDYGILAEALARTASISIDQDELVLDLR